MHNIHIYIYTYIHMYDDDMIVVSKRHNNTSSRCGSRRCEWCVCVCVCVCVCDNIFARRWLCGARMRINASLQIFDIHSSLQIWSFV